MAGGIFYYWPGCSSLIGCGGSDSYRSTLVQVSFVGLLSKRIFYTIPFVIIPNGHFTFEKTEKMKIKKEQKIYIGFNVLVGDEHYLNATPKEQELDNKSHEIAEIKAGKIVDALSDFQTLCSCKNEILIRVNTRNDSCDPSVTVFQCCESSAFEIKYKLKNKGVENVNLSKIML